MVNTILQSNTADLQEILNMVNELPEEGEQATPEISISSDGLITAVAGDKSAIKQLDVQAAQTIIPTTIDKTIASGRYLTGTQTIKGDSNLIAENIKSGVSIFGVTGNHIGGGNPDIEDALVTRAASTYENDRIKSIGSYTFYYYTSLTSVNFPACTQIGKYAFESCRYLVSANFPACTSIGNNAFLYCSKLASINFPTCITISKGAFAYCSSLTTANFPACTSIGNDAFQYCSKLASVNFPACTQIGNYAFESCHNLISLYLTGPSLCTLSNSNAFASTPIGGYSTSAGCYGSIYVPQSLLTSYQTATNWTYFSNRFVGLDIITFTIDGTEYQAEEGMTWAEWCDSEYNTGEFYIELYDKIFIGSSFVSNGNNEQLFDSYDDGIFGTDEIINGGTYYFDLEHI